MEERRESVRLRRGTHKRTRKRAIPSIARFETSTLHKQQDHMLIHQKPREQVRVPESHEAAFFAHPWLPLHAPQPSIFIQVDRSTGIFVGLNGSHCPCLGGSTMLLICGECGVVESRRGAERNVGVSDPRLMQPSLGT